MWNLNYWHLKQRMRAHNVITVGLALLVPGIVAMLLWRWSLRTIAFGAASPLWLKILTWSGIAVVCAGEIMLGVVSRYL